MLGYGLISGSKFGLDAGKTPLWIFINIVERVITALVQRGVVVRGYAFPDDLKKRYARCGRSSAYQPQACG